MRPPQTELGWANPLLLKQFFRAFDVEKRGEITFPEFAEGYSAMLRGTVPELLAFAWRVYHCSGPAELLAVRDMYLVLRAGLAGLAEVDRQQGAKAGAVVAEADGRFYPEESARRLVEEAAGGTKAPLTYEQFCRVVLRRRAFVDCIVPGFAAVPADPVHRVAEAGELEEVCRLIDADGMDVDGRDALAHPTTPLHLAAKYGHAEVVRALLDRGASMRVCAGPDAQEDAGQLPLTIAVRNGREEVVEMLLESTADAMGRGESGETALHVGARAAQFGAMRLVMPYVTVSVATIRDRVGRTPLHCAAECDHWIAIDMLNEFGACKRGDKASLDAKDQSGATALALAASAGAYHSARKLLEMGANPSAVDGEGKSALMRAAERAGNEALVKLLLKGTSVNVNRAAFDGATALHCAVASRDVAILKALLAAGANSDAVLEGSLRTVLHMAVLAGWREAVMVLLAPMTTARVLRDAEGCTPYDYARERDLATLLRQYVKRNYTKFGRAHPVSFMLGLEFYEGTWRVVSDGSDIGRYGFQRQRVSKKLAAKRMAHSMMDADSLGLAFERAGLFVMTEEVRIKRGMMKNSPVSQYLLMRVGCPLYRLQQEAVKMRLQCKSFALDKYEDFYIDENNYPRSAFVALTRPEQLSCLLNIIQSGKVEDAELAGHSGAGLPDVSGAGVQLSLYKQLNVLHEVTVLHMPAARSVVATRWRLRELFTARFWVTTIVEFCSFNARKSFAALEALARYFGPKLAFYFGFATFLTSSLLAPTVAGSIVYGLEWIRSDFAGDVEDDDLTKEITLDDDYDHPLMFALALFLAVWSMAFLVSYRQKEVELAAVLGVDDLPAGKRLAVNPYSTAPVALHFHDGTWAFRPMLTKEQRRARTRYIAIATVPAALLFVTLVFIVAAYNYLLGPAKGSLFDDDCDLKTNCDTAREGLTTNGLLAKYALYGLNGLATVVIDILWRYTAVALTDGENHPTARAFDLALGAKILIVSFINQTHLLFYYAFYEREIDKCAHQLAANLCISMFVAMLFEYVPYLREKSLGARPMLSRRHMRKEMGKGKLEGDHSGDQDFDGYADDEEAEGDIDLSFKEDKGAKLLMDIKRKASRKRELIAAGDLASDATDADLEALESGGGNKFMVKDHVEETFGTAREQALQHRPLASATFARDTVFFGLVVCFGAVWPLAAPLLFLYSFLRLRLDVHKYLFIYQRPMPESVSGTDPFWVGAIEMLALLGMLVHSFICAYSSRTMDEYFFPGITLYERLVAALAACAALQLLWRIYVVMRRNAMPAWLRLSRAEPLRFVRDAYRTGQLLRERRYAALAAGEPASLKVLCAAEDMHVTQAERYLMLVRYVDSLSAETKRKLMYDSSSTISSLVVQAAFASRTGGWVDPGERPTKGSLLAQLVPMSDLHRCYELGKRVREETHRLWMRRPKGLVHGSSVATALAVRQFACIALDLSLGQAERCCRLCRLVDSMNGNCYDALDELAREFPGGLVDVLDAKSSLVATAESLPSALGPVIEPQAGAGKAVRKAHLVRRAMYEAWLVDRTQLPVELLAVAAKKMGITTHSCERYLLLRRYYDTLSREAQSGLVTSNPPTLQVAAKVSEMVRDGRWVDPGEPPQGENPPPAVVSWSDDGELNIGSPAAPTPAGAAAEVGASEAQ